MILDYLNFPMLNPHRQVCKYGPHLWNRESFKALTFHFFDKSIKIEYFPRAIPFKIQRKGSTKKIWGALKLIFSKVLHADQFAICTIFHGALPNIEASVAHHRGKAAKNKYVEDRVGEIFHSAPQNLK